MTKQDHVKWCKQRALETLDYSGPEDAWASMVSDMSKHDETRQHLGLMLGSQLQIAGHLRTPEQVKKFIEGFN